MLVRILGNRNTYISLLGVKVTAITLEGNLEYEVNLKIKTQFYF